MTTTTPPHSEPALRSRRQRPAVIVVGVGMLISLLAQAAAIDDSAPAAEPSSAGEPAPITLAFVGDIHFEGDLGSIAESTEDTLGPMSEILADADIAVANLETPVTDVEAPAAKELEDPESRYWFRSPPGTFDALTRSGIDVVSVANNHAADHGVEGLLDTLDAGQTSDVAVVGAGRDHDEAFAPIRHTVGDTTVAVLAADASPVESGDAAWTVEPGSGPGIAAARDQDTSQLVEAVGRADDSDDLVVIYLHWGEEGSSCPTPSQQQLATEIAEAGADIIVGSHAHRPQGTGTLAGTYVSYGLGNFFWYHGRESQTGILELTVTGDEVNEETWHPGRIPTSGGAPRPITGDDRAEAVHDWHRLRSCTNLDAGPGGPDQLPEFTAPAQPIDADTATRMRGSHDPDQCPVPLSDLRLLTPAYIGFDGEPRRGELIVHHEVVEDVQEIFAVLYDERYPLRRMQLLGGYDGNDNRSMSANNTSGYNCRPVAGTDRWSDHAYGRAIDINPVQNPYLVDDQILPAAGSDYADIDRGPDAPPRPGVISENDAAFRAFTDRGWTWGGHWTAPDYQHFSAP